MAAGVETQSAIAPGYIPKLPLSVLGSPPYDILITISINYHKNLIKMHISAGALKCILCHEYNLTICR